MKKWFTCPLSFLLFSCLYAQQDVKLPGIVVEQNSQFLSGEVAYLSNVQISSVGAATQLSDANGAFTLVFADKPPGKTVWIHVVKYGYNVVNDRELENAAVLDRRTPLKIVMCKAGQLFENQMTYYGIAEDAVKTAYARRLKLLEQEGKEKDILIAEMQTEFNQKIISDDQAKRLLQEQLNTSQQQARELADKFLTVNLDDQSETYQNAFRAFLEKDIDGALAILSTVDLEERLAVNTRELAKAVANAKIYDAAAKRQIGEIAQDIEVCALNARLHILKYEFEEAERLFEVALKYDENKSLMVEYADFLLQQNKFSKANLYFQEALAYIKNAPAGNNSQNPLQMGVVLNSLGTINMELNEFELARQFLEEALGLYKNSTNQNSDAGILRLYSEGLMLRGRLFSLNRRDSEAKECLENALQINASLKQFAPRLYLQDRAMILTQLSSLLNLEEQSRIKREYLEEILAIYRQLHSEDPSSLPIMAKLGVSLNKLGTYWLDADAAFARGYFQEALDISKKLVAKNRPAYLPELAVSLGNISLLESSTGDFSEAKKHADEMIAIYRELVAENEEVYLNDLGNALGKIGIILYQNNEYTEALKFYEEALSISRKLAARNPEVYLTQLQQDLLVLAIISIRQKGFDAAQAYYLEAGEIAKELALKAPGTSFELFETGSVFIDQLNNIDVDVLTFRLKEDLKFKIDLAARNPRLYIPELARVMNNLGVLLIQRYEIDEARVNFENAIDIYRDLVAEDPAYYLPYVVVIFNNLGEYISAWGLKVVDFSKIDYLCQYLSEIENTPGFSSANMRNVHYAVGILYLGQRKGCRKDLVKAELLLNKAYSEGIISACLVLGRVFGGNYCK